MTAPRIRPATVDDVRAIKSLLARYTLPRADLGRYVDHFLVAEVDGRIAGSAGLEVYGRAAVLRSVAVEESLRGSGLGTRLTEEALSLARRAGVRKLYLFTVDAVSFFERFGFRTLHLEQVDAAIQGSPEYRLVRRWWPNTDVKVMGLEL